MRQATLGGVETIEHGENARELELLVSYGMTPVQALRAASSVDAKPLHLDGQSRAGSSAIFFCLTGVVS